MVSKAKVCLGLACFTFGSSIAAGLLTPVRGPNGELCAASGSMIRWTVLVAVLFAAAGFIPLLLDLARQRQRSMDQIRREMEACAQAYLSDLQDSLRNQQQPIQHRVEYHPQEGYFVLWVTHPTYLYPADRSQGGVLNEHLRLVANQENLKYLPEDLGMWFYRFKSVSITFRRFPKAEA